MKKLLKIHEKDNVSLAVEPVNKGEKLADIRAKDDIPFGHKIALKDISKGESVIKFGFSIGNAFNDIKKGEWVHSHNLKSAIEEHGEYTYNHQPAEETEYKGKMPTFRGYVRENGSIGIRNEIWILPLVGCANKTAEILCKKANEAYGSLCDGFYAFTHPYGCSQLGEDHKNTQRILAGLAKHPNACGVLLLSLGCENNNLESFLPVLGDCGNNTRTLVLQGCCDEISEGMKILSELADSASHQQRTEVTVDKLVIGFKCGGSDAFSGITANPLCGRLTDMLTAFGSSAILTEVPEMFGAETALMNRAKDRGVFNAIVSMINDFKEYFVRHGQVVYENPSPGNKEGGITTLEEKSVGCIQKGGSASVRDVLEYGEQCIESGLNLLTGPGNDIVSCTNLAASGAQIILFTTGRGTPLGAPVPTIKIASNSGLARRKANWIDYNAGEILEEKSFATAAAELFNLILSIANGGQTKNEINGYREIAILKDGVTL